MQLVREFFTAFVRNHFRQHFDSYANDVFERLPIQFVPYRELHAFRGEGLVLIEDLPLSEAPSVRKIEKFSIEFELLDCFEQSQLLGFGPDEKCDLFWRNSDGALLPCWNLVGVLIHYLQFIEEESIESRDEHGRAPIELSSLKRLGLLEKPIINDYMFLLLSAALEIELTGKSTDPSKHIKRPVLVLSHDCDQLRGNDLYTQSIRLYRSCAPMLKLKPPKLRYLWWIIQNCLQPYRFYTEDLLAMLELEGSYNYRSSCYLLNGVGGRFGARSGIETIKRFLKLAPETSFGVHYNYEYALNKNKLEEQLEELRELGLEIASGRAHYLTFRPEESFEVLRELGIRVDESVGFSEESSFRVGYAGAFEVWNKQGPIGVTEIPLVFMDANVSRPNLQKVFSILRHIERVGGTISLLFHPGTFESPEHKDLKGVYAELLSYFSRHNYRNMLPHEVADALSGDLVDSKC